MTKLTPEDKQRIYKILAEAYIDLVGQRVIGKVERKVLSRKILDHIEPAKTFEDVVSFIKDLGKTYPYFTNAATRINGELNIFHEKKVIQNLEQYINTINSVSN
jgi:hypothetical protein